LYFDKKAKQALIFAYNEHENSTLDDAADDAGRMGKQDGDTF
jgi:hypothetical protein